LFLKKWKLSSIGLVMGGILMLLMVLSTAVPAFATGCSDSGSTCNYTLEGASLAPTYANITIVPTSLNGNDQTLTITLPVDIVSQNGQSWYMQLGMTPFVGESHTLPTTLGVAMSGECDSGSTCSLPDGSTPEPSTSMPLTPALPSITAAGSGSSPTMNTLITTSESGTPGAYYGMGSMTLMTTLTTALLAKSTYPDVYQSYLEVTVVASFT
jgi:hypothetical protein